MPGEELGHGRVRLGIGGGRPAGRDGRPGWFARGIDRGGGRGRPCLRPVASAQVAQVVAARGEARVGDHGLGLTA
ncbi:MAG: hypothetical protein DLM58_15270 [Pseudonocardiales bacterium]|nr:MAG: hypothetical protein DLM58_15270 [Pseudonocardiales bacterium]